MSGIITQFCCSAVCCGLPQICTSLISNTTALAIGNTCANILPSTSSMCSGILSSCSTMCGSLVSLIGGIFGGGSSGGASAAVPAVMQGATGK